MVIGLALSVLWAAPAHAGTPTLSLKPKTGPPTSQVTVSGLEQKWAVPTVAGAAPDPVVADGLVYVAPADGLVRALDASTGSLVWSFDMGAAGLGAAPTFEGGRLFVESEDGTVYALDAKTGGFIWSVNVFRDGNLASQSTVKQALTVTHGMVIVSGTE